jgi:glycosyltransferase involved in cell wall biosynthesis
MWIISIAHVTTLHGRLDLPRQPDVCRQFPEAPLLSISEAQRRPLATINPGNYPAFIGRISPEKRGDRAFEISQRVGMPIRIAAKVDRVDAEYFTWKIKPLLDHPLVEFIGLAMIEAPACGTPVIGFRNGSVPEIIEDGTTGFMVTSVEQAVDGLRNGSWRRIRPAAAMQTR